MVNNLTDFANTQQEWTKAEIQQNTVQKTIYTLLHSYNQYMIL